MTLAERRRGPTTPRGWRPASADTIPSPGCTPSCPRPRRPGPRATTCRAAGQGGCVARRAQARSSRARSVAARQRAAPSVRHRQYPPVAPAALIRGAGPAPAKYLPGFADKQRTVSMASAAMTSRQPRLRPTAAFASPGCVRRAGRVGGGSCANPSAQTGRLRSLGVSHDGPVAVRAPGAPRHLPPLPPQVLARPAAAGQVHDPRAGNIPAAVGRAVRAPLRHGRSVQVADQAGGGLDR